MQQPSIPIWVGASGEKRSLPMVAKHADAWHCFGDVNYVGHKSTLLDGMCEAAGRDPSTLLRSASISIEGSVDDARREIDAWREAGVGYLIAGWPSGGRAQVETFAPASWRVAHALSTAVTSARCAAAGCASRRARSSASFIHVPGALAACGMSAAKRFQSRS